MLVYSDQTGSAGQVTEPADKLLLELETMEVSAVLRKLKSLANTVDAFHDLRGWGVPSSGRTGPPRLPSVSFEEFKEALYVKSRKLLILDHANVVLPAGTFFRVAGTSTEAHPSKGKSKLFPKGEVVVERFVLTALHPDDPTKTVNYLYRFSNGFVGNLFEPIRNEMVSIAIAATGL